MNVSAGNLNGNSAHFMSLSALLPAQTVSFLHWNSATIDKVLVQGGSLYLSAFENVNIQHEGFLLVNELPTVVRCRWDADKSNIWSIVIDAEP